MSANPGHTSIDYGPRQRILFTGDERQYELWEVKFLGFMKIRGLDSVLENIPDDELSIDSQVESSIDQTKNSEVYAELVQVLDDRSLSLIMRDAKNDGRKAVMILRGHYLPKGKPRVITLYTELTSLVKKTHETVTDYIIRAETAQASLKNAGESISDSLLTAMVLKGLPKEYQPFTTVITQKEKSLSFSEFKVALRNFEDTAMLQKQSAASTSSVMTAQVNSSNSPTTQKPKRWCKHCKMTNHDTEFCRRNKNAPNKSGATVPPKSRQRWCEICMNNSHDTKYCRKLSKFRQLKVEDSNESDTNSNFIQFCFDDSNRTQLYKENSLLVDSGATVHVINDKSKFSNFKSNFKPQAHTVELADGTRKSELVKGQGDAKITLFDITGCKKMCC